MTTISTIKKLVASTAIAGSLGLALGGAVLTVAAPANAAPSSANKWSAIDGHPEEAQRVGDAARASAIRTDWEGRSGSTSSHSTPGPGTTAPSHPNF